MGAGDVGWQHLLPVVRRGLLYTTSTCLFISASESLRVCYDIPVRLPIHFDKDELRLGDAPQRPEATTGSVYGRVFASRLTLILSVIAEECILERLSFTFSTLRVGLCIASQLHFAQPPTV